MKKSLSLALLAAAVSTSALADGPIERTLKDRGGKAVTVILTSGTEITGTVGDVKDGSVVLKQLAGKDFYDALVNIEDIAALEMKVRP